MLVKPLADIQQRLQEIEFHEEFDLIVAIARGGIIPAVMLQARLGCSLEWLWLHFRDDQQKPLGPRPELVKPVGFGFVGKTILLVDDRSTSGSTLNRAKEFLQGAACVKTLVVNGKADYSLFNDECFYFPWRMDIPQGTATETKEMP